MPATEDETTGTTGTSAPDSRTDQPDPGHYAAAARAWDDAYADRNSLPRFDWDALRPQDDSSSTREAAG